MSRILLVLVTLAACEEIPYEPPERSTRAFDVELADGQETGRPDARLPFPSAVPATIRLHARAIDPTGALDPTFNGVARVTAVPGLVLEAWERVRFVDGVADIEVPVRFAYGETRLWVEDVGEDPLRECADGKDNDLDGRVDAADPDCLQGAQGEPAMRATLATGISPRFFFAEPRIRDLQFSPRCTTDTPLGGENVTIGTGELIVTGTTQSGAYVTDLTGPPGGFNSVFLFTFSNPGDVRRGDRLCSIAGNAAEFIGNTQLNFPSFVLADTSRNGVIDGADVVPCALEEPERIGEDAVPPPVVLTVENLLGAAGEVPADFYLTCGENNTVIPGLTDATDCDAARNALPAEFRRSSVIDCRRDNFGMEPWEHTLVAFDDVTISTTFRVCDLNGDGSIQRGGDPEGECESECGEDPLCTMQLSLASFGQFGAGIGCVGAVCEGKIYLSTRDTLGGSGYDSTAHPGERYSRVMGHLRQTQPGAGVESIWIVEPRFLEDFIP